MEKKYSITKHSLWKPIPVLIQSEATECGLACIAMIAGYYGHQVDLRSARAYYQTSQHGASLRDLITIASRFGLSSRPVKAEIDAVSQLRLPCVIHWKFNHYVVLKARGRRNYSIVDPEKGERRVSAEEFSDSFTGIALELWTNENFVRKKEKSTVTLFSMFRTIRRLPATLIYIFSITLCVEVITICVPITAQFFIDTAFQSYDTNLVTLVSIAVISLLCVRFALSFARAWLAMLARTEINIAWSCGLFSHMINLPIDFFERRHVGDVSSRFMSMTAIQDVFTSDVVNAILDSVLIIFLFMILIIYNPMLSAIVFALTLVYTVSRIITYKYARAAIAEAIAQEAVQHSHFLETVRAIALVKLFGIADRRQTKWINHVVDEINAKIVSFRIDLFNQSLGVFLASLSLALVLWAGSFEIISGRMSLGMLFAYIVFIELFINRAIRVVDALGKIMLVRLHADRIAEIALAPLERNLFGADKIFIKNSEKPSVKQAAAAICVKNLSFQYSESVTPVISNLSFDISAGESVAITGPSGCGKSTLLKLLVGLVMPDAGYIKINNLDIRQIGLNNYRDSIACVLQNGQLFAGSLLDNISMFDPLADREWVQECARLAAIADEIEAMPMRYDTMVGDMGSILSGGQKQRISIARALYKRPAILFMDEATSDLDIVNEEKINNAIRDLRITRVFIAHRPSTIAVADRVLALNSLLAESNPGT